MEKLTKWSSASCVPQTKQIQKQKQKKQKTKLIRKKYRDLDKVAN
jgi:hypothetical protein